MPARRALLTLAGLSLAAGLAVAGCGSTDASSGTLVGTYSSFPDSLDPALSVTARLSREQLGPRQIRGYSELDREAMVQAPWAPFGNFTTSTFVSSAIDLDQVIVSPIFGQDLTSFRFK
jgi:hypothetical protein